MPDESAHGSDWFSDDTATFGDRLVGAREAVGLSQDDLAKRLGVKPKTIKGWENDLNEPRANKLQMLAGLLNVSIMWLLTGRGDGLDGPVTRDPGDDIARLLLELRQVRGEHVRLVENLTRLEKRMRAALVTGKDAE